MCVCIIFVSMDMDMDALGAQGMMPAEEKHPVVMINPEIP